MLFDLNGKTALVAGGAGYLGRAVCAGLAESGANVIVADIDMPGVDDVVDGLRHGHPATRPAGLSLDVRRDDSIQDALGAIRDRYGRLDILVTLFWVPHGKDWSRISSEEFTRCLHGNVTATFTLARGAKELMSDGGSVILFSSMYGRVSPYPGIYEKPMVPNPVEYGVSKAGLDQMIRYLAVAWAADGIRVNGIAPGPFPNPEVQKAHPDFIKRLAQKVPLGRIGSRHEVAGAVIYLASPAASYVTGHILAVDGGWTAW